MVFTFFFYIVYCIYIFSFFLTIFVITAKLSSKKTISRLLPRARQYALRRRREDSSARIRGGVDIAQQLIDFRLFVSPPQPRLGCVGKLHQRLGSSGFEYAYSAIYSRPIDINNNYIYVRPHALLLPLLCTNTRAWRPVNRRRNTVS